MKKVWTFCHHNTPPEFGQFNRHYNLANCLKNDGYEPIVFVGSVPHNTDVQLINGHQKYMEYNKYDYPFIFIKTCKYKGNGLARIYAMLQYFIKIFSVSKKIEKKYGKPDIIYASSAHPLVCVAGILIARRYKIKCICEIRDLWPLSLIELGALKEKSIIARLLFKLEHWIYKKADAIVFTMEGGKDYIKDRCWEKDVDINKVYHINNGVDLKAFKDSVENNVIVDKDLDNPDTFKVLYTGSMGKANNIKDIIKCAKNVKQYNNIKFILYGDGYERTELEKLCESENLDNVIFKGTVSKKYIPYILSKADLNIIVGQPKYNLYKYGLSLNKLFEYLASGKPVVSSIVCGYDILRKYNAGFTVDDADKLTEIIKDFYTNKDSSYQQYCINAIKASEEYTFQKLGNRLERVINYTIENDHKIL